MILGAFAPFSAAWTDDKLINSDCSKDNRGGRLYLRSEARCRLSRFDQERQGSSPCE